MNSSALKILHAPTNPGGNPWGLAQGERAIGLDSTVMCYQRTWLDYPCDIALDWNLSSRTRQFMFFLKSLTEYDIFHFNYGTSLLTSSKFSLYDFDLPAYRLFGKKVVVTYNGCDARQQDYCISHFAWNACSEPDCYGGCCDKEADDLRRRRIRRFAGYAHKILSVNPDLLRVLPGAEFIPYTIPDFHKLLSTPVAENRERYLKILHAPSDRGAKGTKYILPVLERIQREDRRVKVLLVERFPYNQAREIYRGVDLAIDQLLIGWYGALAVEAMALGKPVICYIREDDLQFIPSRMREDLPVIRADRNNLYEVIKSAIEEKRGLLSLGEKSREYVRKWHDPIKIAGRMKAIYESL